MPLDEAIARAQAFLMSVGGDDDRATRSRPAHPAPRVRE
jgi:hypothetical protein